MGASARVTADVTGTVWKIHVGVGDIVSRGQEIAILESMKMEIPVVTDHGGVVSALHVDEQDSVLEGDVVAEIAAE